MALLKKFESDFGTVHVTRSKADGTMAYVQNGSYHSQANQNGISICAYVHVIHEIIRQTAAHQILMVGCAGGTLATMLSRLGCKVTVVDINPVSFVVAKRYFHMPESVRCICRDGLAYIKSTKKIYDAVIVDVFGANNAVPDIFTTPSFFQHVERVLTIAGVMVMNVITADDKDHRADIIARNAASIGMEIDLFDWPGEKDRNSLVVSGMAPHICIPSGKEPDWMKDDFKGLILRTPKKYLAA